MYLRAKARTDNPSTRESRRIAAYNSTLDIEDTGAPYTAEHPDSPTAHRRVAARLTDTVPLPAQVAPKQAVKRQRDSPTKPTPHVVSREARSITSTDPDLLKVTLHRRTPAIVRQGSQHRRVKTGDLVICDTARPYELTLPDICDVVVIGLPRSMLGTHADLISHRTAAPLASDAGTRGLITTFLSNLGDQASGLPGSPGIHLGDALASLIIAAFTEITAERADVRTALADRILVYAQANLDNPTLSVESVARQHGISPRHLHQLFRQRDYTFAAWVRHERLRRIRRDLLDPRLVHRTTAAIASRWGIHDFRHLSRALKAEFGHTAAEIRRTALPE